MKNSNSVIQNPVPGTRILMFRGDTRSFILTLAHSQKGSAWFRTNIGHAKTTRKEIITEVENNRPPLGRDWFDLPMKRIDDQRFIITVPLCEVGHFEGKCFFLPKGETRPVWPEGPNVVINVEPADTCCSNIIYNAFVRQFGPNKSGNFFQEADEELIRSLDKNGYTVIPPSGTFRDLIKELDFIIGELGCRVIQLLPIHPTPTTYARMGRFGSPYAALSFTAVDSALAEFDSRATPLEQFIELVDAIHERQASIFIDIAINHTGWAAGLHETHPQWLVRDSDGKIEVPGAWGVVWADLTRLDYTKKDLWEYMADVFITWCRRGVDGFRCDAGYMIPVSAWRYILARVREQYPDTIFILEGLGGKISVSRDILNRANFNWAYSELFQNYDRGQIEAYLPGANEISASDGIAVHFAETHDNLRLAERSDTYACMRTALCALCSSQGGFGFANGVEWYATEKINVHGASSLNWGSKTNQVKHIRRLNTLLKIHPAFHDRTELKMLQKGEGNHLALFRHHLPSGRKLLILVNLDDKNETLGTWDHQKTGMSELSLTDLISGEMVTMTESHEHGSYLLDPGEILCLTDDPLDMNLILESESRTLLYPERIQKQRLRAKALDIFRFYKGVRELEPFDPDEMAQEFTENPVEFCRSLNPFSDESRIITWQWPRDIRREVMILPDHFLMVRADTSFRARIMDEDRCLVQEESLPCSDGSFFALFSPMHPTETRPSCTLKVSVYTPGDTQHVDGPLIFLPRAKDATVKGVFNRTDLSDRSLIMLGTNGRGGMLRAFISWGELSSRYDALLAANIDAEIPEDRWIMFTRCRAWLVFQEYSQEICDDCFVSFYSNPGSKGIWRFQVPTGQGQHVFLSVYVEMISKENGLRMMFNREPAKGRNGRLPDHEPVRLILRPDIENRNFHDTTKAYQGPEHTWQDAVDSKPDGFNFSPDRKHQLNLRISDGDFVWEPEWQYMIHRPKEAERGLDPDSDLFSPGYFETFLTGDGTVTLNARIGEVKTLDPEVIMPSIKDSVPFNVEKNKLSSPLDVLEKAMDHYTVNRGALHTVIAGYPWFLDWGRDALIFVRGLIAAGKTDETRDIIKLFGQYEADGTIPNMIQGENAKNRDTSDAPLWYCVACDELLKFEKSDALLEMQCGNRTVRRILLSIGHAYMTGTSNGIRMDPESGLIFSPSHFTWMDTNFPAGTPREGYPIEIQALWYATLSLLARIDPSGDNGHWERKAIQVQSSILEHYILKDEAHLADCLHAGPGVPASQAEPDDALRPNQLLAVTLGAVSDVDICRKVVAACEELLIPGAIRSLADRPVRRPLIIEHHGKMMNDPDHPYQGIYIGDEDTKRKPAYHNGTAWTWMFPSYCEAWIKAYGIKGKKTALDWLASCAGLVSNGCIGHVPEILDGDFPHLQRGCEAQAWGVSEIVRVWKLIESLN
ncbi:MAG: amylo-alpha-1,6-glucosidase [Desulfobacterales bacterium]